MGPCGITVTSWHDWWVAGRVKGGGCVCGCVCAGGVSGALSVCSALNVPECD